MIHHRRLVIMRAQIACLVLALVLQAAFIVFALANSDPQMGIAIMFYPPLIALGSAGLGVISRLVLRDSSGSPGLGVVLFLSTLATFGTVWLYFMRL